MQRVVYLLGLPCTGKSTIVRKWHENGGATLPEFFEPVPDFVHNSWLGDEKTQVRAQEWALQQHIKKDRLLRTLNYEGPIVVERSPIDVIVYRRALGRKAALWTDTAVSQRQWTPGVLILLETDYESLKDRWISSRKLSPESWENQWGPYSKSLQIYYEFFKREFGFPVLQTERSLEETMTQLYQLTEHGATYNIESLIKPHSRMEKEQL